MSVSIATIALVLAAVAPASAGEPDATQHHLATSIAAVAPAAPDAPSASPRPVAAGEVAPDFQFQGYDWRWRQLHHLLAKGDVLLVIGPSEEKLRALQREHAALSARGIIPVAVLGVKGGPAWSLVHEMGLPYSVLSDPRHEIATDFRVRGHDAGHPEPTWFVIARDGRVRDSGADIAGGDRYAEIAAAALGLQPPRASLAAGW